MTSTTQHLQATSLLIASLLTSACGAGGEGARLSTEPGSGGTATTGGAGPTGGSTVAPLGGAPPTHTGGVGLYSEVFEPIPGAGSGGSTAAPVCEPTTACDFTRQTGCCERLSCDHANRADVWNSHPIEACKALVKCVQDHPGCTTASDPLCFQNEAATAPCLTEGYNASHNEPDGPFAYTLELMRCLCGY